MYDTKITPQQRVIYQSATWIVLLISVLARIVQYGFNRSLWLDEVWLALNIINRDMGGLLTQLDDNQVAPIGFLVVTKLITGLLGEGEYALRLFPFLASLGGLFLLVRLSNQFSIRITPFVLAVFGFSNSMIYYSSELKQYALDPPVMIIIVLTTLATIRSHYSAQMMLALTGVGMIAIWFSHPAIFLLAGVGVTLFIDALFNDERDVMLKLIPTGILWLLSFGLMYITILTDAGDNDYLSGYWGSAFLPFPPTSINDLIWYIRQSFGFFALFANPPNLLNLTMVVFFFLMGWRMVSGRDRSLLTSAVIFMLIASALGFWPLAHRFLHILLPGFAIIIGFGAVDMVERFTKATTSRWIRPVLITLIIAIPLTVMRVNHTRIETRPVLESVAAVWQPGDRLCVDFSVDVVLQYYQTLPPTDCQVDETASLSPQADRTWFIITDQYAEEVWQQLLDEGFSPQLTEPHIAAFLLEQEHTTD